MIRKSDPMSMAESLKYIPEGEENAETIAFIKKFVKISPEDAEKMKEKIVSLELMKVRDIHVPKIIDLMPASSEELNKIFSDVSLDDEETKKILDIVSEFK